MAVTEQVIIEFVSDSSGLAPAVDQLEALGKIDKQTAQVFKQTNAELQRRGKELQAVGAGTAKATRDTTKIKSTFADLDKEIKNFTKDFIAGFQEGIEEELKKASAEAEQFAAATKKGTDEVGKSSESLKSKLRQMEQQLVKLKLEGKENTAQYKKMAQEAGELRDAIGDVSAEVRRLGSDTAVFDGLLNAAQGVAGGFAVAQGFVALFGDESEELQEVLLRVNAAMAILQGLQSVSNVLQKESAASLLLISVQQRIYNAQLVVEAGLQSRLVVVRIAATAAQKALNLAMASNPIGLFITALVLATAAIYAYVKSSKEAEIQTGRLNAAVESATGGFEEYTRNIKNSSELAVSELEKVGAKQSDILKNQLQAEKDINQKRSEEIARLRKTLTEARDADDETYNAANKRLKDLAQERSDSDVKIQALTNKLNQKLREEDLNNAIGNLEARLALTSKNSAEELKIEKELVAARALLGLNQEGLTEGQKLAILRKSKRDQLSLEREFQKVILTDKIAGIEASLLVEQNKRERFTERVSQTEIDLQKKSILEKANRELLQEGLTEKQRFEIKQRALNEITRLQREFNKQSAKETLEDLISANNAELARIGISNEEKQRLLEENIITQAEIEISEAEGVASKIKEINARRDAQIKASRLQRIKEEADYEIELNNARNGPLIRELNRMLKVQSEIDAALTEKERKRIERVNNLRRLSIQEQFALIDKVTNYEIAEIDVRLEALNESFIKGLISQKEYNLRYAQLMDQQAQIVENGEKKKQNAIDNTNKQATESAEQLINNTIAIANQLGGLLDNLFKLQSDKENQRISEQRANVAALREAGAITEKEEIKRLRVIEAEEKRIKRQQAQRDKQVAIFQAVINTAAGVAKAIPNIALMAIAAAIGAAQIALIASRPIPKFRKGKKDSYEGLGEVGEAGAELIEKDGKMFIAEKPTVIWLGKKDKVYTPEETARKLTNKALPVSTKNFATPKYSTQKTEINYKALAKEIGQEVGKNVTVHTTQITEKGITKTAKRGLLEEKYLDDRRSFGSL